MKKLLPYMINLSLLLIYSCSSQNITNSGLEKVFTGVSVIDINTISGNCIIKKSDQNQVKVNVIYDYKPVTSFEPVFSQENNVLFLEEKMHCSNTGYSEWTLIVPDKIDIEFNSASGNITIEDITGKMNINTASGNIIAKGIGISDDSEFTSASGVVNVSFNTSPKYDVLISSASSDATINFNENQIIGNVEMKARVELGVLICPFKFEKEEENVYGNQKYVIKSIRFKDDTPNIKIHTASGKAILKK